MEQLERLETVTEVLREELKRANISHVARVTGIDNSQLHRFKSGKRDILCATVDRLAAYFGLVLGELAE